MIDRNRLFGMTFAVVLAVVVNGCGRIESKKADSNADHNSTNSTASPASTRCIKMAEMDKLIAKLLAKESFRKFNDRFKNLSLSYPSFWVLKKPEVGTPFIASGLNSEIIDFRIQREETGDKLTAEQYLQSINEIVRKSPDASNLNILSTTKISVAGVKAVRQIQTIQLNKRNVVLKQDLVIFVKSGIAYTVVGATPVELFPRLEPVFDRLCQSISVD